MLKHYKSGEPIYAIIGIKTWDGKYIYFYLTDGDGVIDIDHLVSMGYKLLYNDEEKTKEFTWLKTRCVEWLALPSEDYKVMFPDNNYRSLPVLKREEILE